jgi:hypothetical protein
MHSQTHRVLSDRPREGSYRSEIKGKVLATYPDLPNPLVHGNLICPPDSIRSRIGREERPCIRKSPLRMVDIESSVAVAGEAENAALYAQSG